MLSFENYELGLGQSEYPGLFMGHAGPDDPGLILSNIAVTYTTIREYCSIIIYELNLIIVVLFSNKNLIWVTSGSLYESPGDQQIIQVNTFDLISTLICIYVRSFILSFLIYICIS